MQALCPRCNAKKGASVTQLRNFTYDQNKLRPGQRGAIDTILTRRRAEERFTSIVLPTRYGKSDVARLSALHMIRDGLVSNALMVAPAVNLVEQLLDPSKLENSARLYGFPVEAYGIYDTIIHPPRIKRLRDSRLSSITTQMANLWLSILTQWIDLMRGPSGPGVPPVVYMDEAHLGSDGNRWGHVATSLADAGAHVVVMTATPFRADGRPIPGFQIEDRVVLGTTSRGGERVLYDMEPHWVTTLQEAMEETPPPLAQVTYQPFGLGGMFREFSIDDVSAAPMTLDGLERDDDIRRAYREALRKPAIVEDAVRYFLTDLGNRRRDPRQRNVSGIIFVGNQDSEFDRQENEHAFTVKSILRKLAPRLRCEIIVSSDPDAQNLLDEFLGEVIDVAIVKQMGALGLDAPHLKTALDLSNTRSPAYFLQRVMRIATRWEVEGFPDPVLRSTYIAPDDRITRRTIDALFKGTGVLVPVTEGLEPSENLDIEPRAQPELRHSTFDADSVVLTGNMQDAVGKTAPATYIPLVDSFFAEFSSGTGDISKAGLGNWLQRAGVSPDAQIPGDDEATQGDMGTDQAPVAPESFNLTKMLDAVRSQASELGKVVINRRYERFRRVNDKPYSQEEYGRTAARFWSDQFRAVGLPAAGTRLETIDDIEKLRAICRNIQKELEEGSDGIR